MTTQSDGFCGDSESAVCVEYVHYHLTCAVEFTYTTKERNG